jgi:hypothetical protein
VFENVGQASWRRDVSVWQGPRLAETRKVDSDDVVVLLERLAHRPPAARAEAQPVHENQRRPGAPAVERERRLCVDGR